MGEFALKQLATRVKAAKAVARAAIIKRSFNNLRNSCPIGDLRRFGRNAGFFPFGQAQGQNDKPWLVVNSFAGNDYLLFALLCWVAASWFRFRR
jgi:hypothetical protein